MSDRQILAEGVRLLPLRTPTLPPATHTNCLIVGDRRLAVVEPATPFADQQRALDQEIDALTREGRTVVALLITHHHPDHVGYAAELRARLGVPLYAHAETARRVSFPIDRLLGDGDRVELDGGMSLVAHFTPGHAPGHLVYLETRSGFAHAGDMVAGTGTILIDPGDSGDMSLYLSSLEKVGAIGARALVPAHGPVLPDPVAVVRHYVAHRLMREEKVVRAIGEGAPLGEVLARAYDDTPKLLWPLALRSLEAHLAKLVAEGRVRRDGDMLLRVVDRG